LCSNFFGKSYRNQNGALRSFKEQHRVTQEMIEAKFGYNADSFTEYDYVELINIFNSLRDGVSMIEDWFNKEIAKNQSSGLGADFQAQSDSKIGVKSDAPNDIPIEQPELPLE